MLFCRERVRTPEKKKIKQQPIVSTSFDPEVSPLERPGIIVLEKARREPRRGE